jgi:hypothetical protein
MSEHSKNEMLENFLTKFTIKELVEETMRENYDSHLPLVLTANLTIFASSTAILIYANDADFDASKLIILLATFFSLLSSMLNIWYLARVKIREEKLKKEQDKIFDNMKEDFTNLLNLFADVAKKGQVYEGVSPSKYLIEKGGFVFLRFNELASLKTINNFKKCLDEPLDEKYAVFKLFIDRLSEKMKNFGLVVSFILIICALLIITIIET